MASASTRAKINFIKLNQEELTSRVALLVSQHSRVVFWKTSPRYYEGESVRFDVKSHKTYLTIGKCNIHRRLVGERICLNFVVNDIDYFIRGHVVEQLEDHLEMVVELEQECFRVEKRTRERLVTYPIYEVYAYLKFKKEVVDNVVFLNKREQVTRDFISEIDNLEKRKIQSLSSDLEVDEEEEIVGFRVEDLSSSGLSFFASTKEKELIIDKLSTSSFSLTLNFEMQVFTLENATVVYKINYINSQFAGVPMYKVGITFKPSPSLKKKIENHTGITVDLHDLQKEFEEFIKNE